MTARYWYDHFKKIGENTIAACDSSSYGHRMGRIISGRPFRLDLYRHRRDRIPDGGSESSDGPVRQPRGTADAGSGVPVLERAAYWECIDFDSGSRPCICGAFVPEISSSRCSRTHGSDGEAQGFYLRLCHAGEYFHK